MSRYLFVAIVALELGLTCANSATALADEPGSLYCTPTFSGAKLQFGAKPVVGNDPLVIDLEATGEGGAAAVSENYETVKKVKGVTWRVALTVKVDAPEPPSTVSEIKLHTYFEKREKNEKKYQTEHVTRPAVADLPGNQADTVLFRVGNSGKTDYPNVEVSCYRTKPRRSVSGNSSPQQETELRGAANKPGAGRPASPSTAKDQEAKINAH